MSENESGLVATVKITTTPQPSDAIVKLQAEAESLLMYARERIIDNDDDAKGAVEDLSIISGVKKALEENRQQYTKPLNARLDTINAVFKTVSVPLAEADKITRDKVLAYNADQDRKRAEAERINALKREVAKAEMELHGEILPDTNTTSVEVPDGSKQRIRGSMGMASKSVNWKWKLKNFAELSDEYKLPDAAKIGKLVRAGMREIPGLEIYPEDNLVVTPKKG
jgi:hypothetical protein